ncbi:uncharacterized protein MONOS_16087 [Monocercomonoides exilis]|uniref:uncharacterized protein n=1 Tax=Monocercomonoides exilis TaxID=2049356 RepID=UPI003559FEE5|nr:hypothetical protein MONOS_16087 [Monocercomonoides exilis]|eukprot:MONOS_16087.1-p1 / transcript=MONOS_16087.1 / gene=MONOS_16087 / organism=Monocercomonoides_exilis_PA203 / gene_product=unspecified product / transcript_product=unspecified product / location=Mono_scaffold01498:4897-5706(+) / protein_length=270 / sequence_SO=supercontig / SO=protein_coding / is_pseudo=false
MKANAAQTLIKIDGKFEGHVLELGVEKEELEWQIPELMELHEEAKQEMEKLYSEFNMLLQKIRDDERISKLTNGLVEQLRQNDKIIRMRKRKILELNEKNNTDVNELQQLVEMKEKAELIDVWIEKEKKLWTQQGGVVSEDSEGAGSGAGAGVPLATPSSLSSAGGLVIPSSASLILLSGLCEKCQEKFAVCIGDGSDVLVGTETSGKGDVVKVKSGISVVGRRQRSMERVSTEVKVRERDLGSEKDMKRNVLSKEQEKIIHMSKALFN